MYDPPLEVLVAKEPWRQGVGYPSTVDDPMWDPLKHELCSGEVHWEFETGKWHCTGCGYVGWASRQQHYPIVAPKTFFEECRKHYVEERTKSGDTSVPERMYFVMAAVLRAAATKKPEELRDFVEKMSRL